MQIIKISNDFWNIRGSFKIGGVIDIGTHASLIKRQNGEFLLLDSLTFTDEVMAEICNLTDNGTKITAVLNLHPFHTVHVQTTQQTFPNAKHYGTARHHKNFPTLNWEPELTESPELHALFADDLEFTVPRGVDFISDNPNLHFSSVLALHKASRTIHVDDTLMYTRLPKALQLIGPADRLSFHMTLGGCLEKRAGAAQDFRDWVNELIEQWGDTDNLCAAHVHTFRHSKAGGDSLSSRMKTALKKVNKTLKKHEKKYG